MVAASSPAAAAPRAMRTRFGRLVTELLQRDDGFGLRIGRHAGPPKDRRRRQIGGAIAQLDHHALGGLLADAGDAGQRGDVAGLHQARELVDADARQHRQRDLRADAADLLHVAEQAALALAQEAVQRDAVFLLRVMREQRDLAADLRQVVERAHRRFEFVADAVDVHHQPGRLLVDEDALQASDHVTSLLHSREGGSSDSVLEPAPIAEARCRRITDSRLRGYDQWCTTSFGSSFAHVHAQPLRRAHMRMRDRDGQRVGGVGLQLARAASA